MLKCCPACAGSLDDHSYTLVGITVAAPANQERLSSFCHLLKDHDWPALMRFDDFDPLLNALEAFAVKCPSEAMVLLAVRNPFELFESNEVLDCEVLDSTTGEQLDSLIETPKWLRLSVDEYTA
jgi:hypothetical protein